MHLGGKLVSVMQLLESNDPEADQVADTVPEEIFYDVLSNGSSKPPGRWGHTAVAYKDRLYVFGGNGPATDGGNFMFRAGVCLRLAQHLIFNYYLQ